MSDSWSPIAPNLSKTMLQHLYFTFYVFSLFFSGPVNSFGAQFLCNHIPGLTHKQRLICESSPDAIAVIVQGTRLGVAECQHQFRFSRWNCTPSGSWTDTERSYGHVVLIGSREAAFLYAITSSGVAYAITQACGRGNISSCGCAPPTTISTPAGALGRGTRGGTEQGSVGTHATWRWGGCSADVDFGMKLARRFMDAREVDGDARSLMNLHNNKAGRKMVQSTLETECKCHGVSGSCTLKTCWLKLPSFREIGGKLLEKYQKARPVVAVQGIKTGPRSRRSLMLLVRPNPDPYFHHRQEEKLDVNSHTLAHYRHFPKKVHERKRSLKDSIVSGRRNSKPRRHELVYLEQSPNYCEEDSNLGSLGTRGRRCLKDSIDGVPTNRSSFSKEESCDILCCGRGYNTHQIFRRWKCGCKFRWCCEVQCQNCQEKVEMYTCN